MQERSNTILEASLRLGVVRVSAGVRIPVLDFGIIRLETTDNDYEIRVRLKVNGRYFTGILERNE